MRRLRTLTLLVLAAAVLLAPSPVQAQEPSPSAPAPPPGPQAIATPGPDFIERKVLEMEKAADEGPHGFSVTFGDIKRGSGPSLGPAYGWTLAGGAVASVKAVYSIHNAKVVQASLRSPVVTPVRLMLSTRARWQDVPDVSFHGLAPGIRGEEAGYSERVSEISGTAAMQPVRWLRLGAGAGREAFRTAVDEDRRLDLFAGAPGVGADPRYLHTHLSAAVDTRESEDYTRSGSLVRATRHDYRQAGDGPYSFRRVDAVAEHYLPVLGSGRVIYLGLHASTTNAARGRTVPFFLMPDVGAVDLRGYDLYRFRNRHSVVVSAEYRWPLRDYLDAAVFYDAGKAVADRRDLDLTGLKGSFGAGVNLHGRKTTPLRLEVARSREGLHFLVSFSAAGG